MKTPTLGATGKFPHGKLNKHDESELRIVIAIDNDWVIIDFGAPVTWLGFSKKEAEEFANLILARAKELS